MSRDITAILAEIKKCKDELAHAAVERPSSSELVTGQQSGKYLGLSMTEEIIGNVLRDVVNREKDF